MSLELTENKSNIGSGPAGVQVHLMTWCLYYNVV